MTVEEILHNKGNYVFRVKENDKVFKVFDIFEERKIGSCMVENEKNEIVGIMTEKDLLKCFRKRLDRSEIEVKDLMTEQKNLIIGHLEDDIQYAMSVMTNKRIKHLPIFKDKKLVGLLSIGDVVKAQMEHSNQVAKTYLDLLLGKVPQSENMEF
ncbi:MAG: CBS domain-containing protein [Candidatus Cloacimonetes bacterium]|nr:CBS domain-containing protein [Candidatus Cloacimonadota bacterium]